MENWLVKNMESVLITIEVLWVGGVVAIFFVYFYIKWQIKKKKAQQEKEPKETGTD